jgi:MATE family multidrug resistance protein
VTSPHWSAEIRATARLATPLVAAQLAQISMSFIDVVMVGRLGPEAMAAVVLGHTVFFTSMLVGVGFVIAVSPLVAQAFGAGDRPSASRAARQGLWVAVLMAGPLIVLMAYAEPLLLAARQDAQTSALAAGYLGALAWGILPDLGFGALRGFMEGIGKPRPILFIALVAAVLNVGANYVLMFGKLGFPALGVVGTGYASALVFWVMFGLMALVVRWAEPYKSYRVFRGLRRPDPSALKELARVGWPIGIGLGVESGMFTAATLLIGTLSVEALAAHQVALNAASVSFMIPLGIAFAATSRVGQAVGRGDPEGVRRAGQAALVLGVGSMLAGAMLFWLLPGAIVAVYLDADAAGAAEVGDLAVILLGIAAVFQLVDGAQAVYGGALRGLKDTKAVMLIALVAYWGVGLTTAVMLTRSGWGAPGVWWGLVVGLAAAAVLLRLRFNAQLRRV